MNIADRYKEPGKEYYFMQPRSSMLGKTEQEIYKFFTTKDEMADDSTAILSANAGTALHRLMQAQQYGLENIVTAEKFIHNKNYNFTGHIDAVSSTLGLGDIKTVSRHAFNRIKRYGPKSSHITQVNSYMTTTGTDKGYIQYVMREDPTQQIIFKLEQSDERFEKDMAKLTRVQERVKRELKEGKLHYSQLRQGKSLKVLQEEGRGAHSSLIKDTGIIEKLVDEFLYYQHKLDRKTGEFKKQKLSYTSGSNSAINPVARRESQNTILGFNHGWFGAQRSKNTDFGSPYQIGKFDLIKQVSGKDIEEMFTNQMGLDIETTSLKGKPDTIFQVAMGQSDERFESLFLKQKDNSLSAFLDKTGIGQTLKRKLGFDFTKEGKLQDYTNHIFNEKERRLKRIYAEVAGKERVRQKVRDFFSLAKQKNKNVLIANANFEIDHLKYLMGNANEVNYSLEYRKLRKELRGESTLDLAKLRTNELKREDVLSREIGRQKRLFGQILKEAKAGKGSIIEVQEIAKTLQAVSQEKGLVPKTGRFAVGSNIENLAEIFLGSKEIHEGVSDVSQQNKIAKEMVDMIREIELGNINKANVSKLKGGQGRYIKAWNENLQGIFEASTVKKIESELMSKGHLMDIDPRRQVSLVGNSPINESKIFQQAQKKIAPEFQEMLSEYQHTANKISRPGGLKYLRTGIAIGGAVAVTIALKNAFMFSGRDDSANTIEGLRHGGYAELHRKMYSDFGSGYQMQNYHSRNVEDPTDTSYAPLMMLGAAGVGAKTSWKMPFKNVSIDELSYFGRLSETKLNSEILGRTQATYGDVFISGIKRAEAALGGLPRSFGISDLIGGGSLDSAEFAVDLTLEKNQSYAKYIDSLVKRNLREEGVHSVAFSKGKLKLIKDAGEEVLPGSYSLVRLSHDLNLNKSMTQFSKAMTRIHGVNYIDPRTHSFIPVGGKGFLESSAARKLHAYTHETITKYVQLLDDPLAAIRELFPDVEIPGMGKVKNITKKLPKLGVGGEQGLVGPTRKMIGRHAVRLGAFGAAMYFGYGTLNWMTKQIAPDDSVLGEAGITGLGAEMVRRTHQAYAKVSDITGMTNLRESVDEMTPGMSGWQASLGLGLSGGLAGISLAFAENLFTEASSAGEHYKKFVEAKKTVERMPEFLRRIPGMKGEYTKIGRYGRMGLLAGLGASLPWLLSGFGAEKSYEELEEEYEGRKEVAVRKGRYWEASMTPWGGSKIDYYRPNWYARLRDDAKTAELYEGEDISPVGKFFRSLFDPYWLEKRRYEKQPYPYTGPDGSAMGIFGPIYEATLGRALKAPTRMHEDEFNAKAQMAEEKYPVNAELGGYGADYVLPSSSTSFIRKQWSSILEAMGLRGFGFGALKEKITGETEINSYYPELESAAAMDSVSKSFYDLQLGGGILTTEALRRVFPREHTGSVSRINPLENKMPSWMPRQGFYINFHEGDPYAKVKEGYYRLPGEGFATRFKELSGVSPEDYPDIYKYKILGDVASGSNEFKKLKEKLSKRTLTPDELAIWNETNRQIEERNESSIQTRDPEMYETFLGRYGAFLTDVARANPVEHLIPLSPSRKFLPGPDPYSAYEEEIYGKTFKSWGSPIDDFLMPAARMALSLGGVADVPEEVEYARQLEDYFDKIEYIKNKRLADQAKEAGDAGTANFYTRKASQTMSGIDPYVDSKILMGTIPKRERGYFKKFLEAPVEQRQRILDIAPSGMKDIYLAQWDKLALESIQSGEAGEDQDYSETAEQIKQRAASLRARRKAQLQDFSRSNMLPEDDWQGWDRRVDLEDVKMKYLVNEGRDYHYYGLWRDRLNLLSRKPYVNAAAENLNFRPSEYRDQYANAYAQAREMGIVDPEVLVLPGLENGIDLEVQKDRQKERKTVLRDLGYII